MPLGTAWCSNICRSLRNRYVHLFVSSSESCFADDVNLAVPAPPNMPFLIGCIAAAKPQVYVHNCSAVCSTLLTSMAEGHWANYMPCFLSFSIPLHSSCWYMQFISTRMYGEKGLSLVCWGLCFEMGQRTFCMQFSISISSLLNNILLSLYRALCICNMASLVALSTFKDERQVILAPVAQTWVLRAIIYFFITHCGCLNKFQICRSVDQPYAHQYSILS